MTSSCRLLRQHGRCQVAALTRRHDSSSCGTNDHVAADARGERPFILSVEAIDERDAAVSPVPGALAVVLSSPKCDRGRTIGEEARDDYVADGLLSLFHDLTDVEQERVVHALADACAA